VPLIASVCLLEGAVDVLVGFTCRFASPTNRRAAN
jgi:hypothetical protein